MIDVGDNYCAVVDAAVMNSDFDSVVWK